MKNQRLLSGDCISAACCLMERPQKEWSATLNLMINAIKHSDPTIQRPSLMRVSNALGRSLEPYWNNALFCKAMIVVLQSVQDHLNFDDPSV
jgi:hypothetical protein